MIEVVQLLFSIMQLFSSWVLGVMVPSGGDITLLHVAVWVPSVATLLAGGVKVVRFLARPRRAPPGAGPAPRPQLARRQRRRHRRARAAAPTTPRQVLAPAAPRQAKPTTAPNSPQRSPEERERAKAEREAQQAAARAQRAEERRAALAQARAQREAQQAAARAQRAEERRAQQEQARAQREAQRAQETAQRAEERRAQQEQARAQREAQRAAERTERAAAREQAQAERRRNRAERPPRPRKAHSASASAETRAFGADPNKVYRFRYRLVDLDQLVTSNTDTGGINPAYDARLQPRMRDRAASQQQIDRVARAIVPESLLWDFHALDKGAPIIGADRQVESGNGRVLALRRARAAYGDQWDAYQAKLRATLAERGLDAAELEGMAAPVLVRERLDEVDRAAFAREANAPPVLQLSTLETALVDSQRMTEASLLQLQVREDQSIDQALRTKANAPFVRAFADTLSDNEQAILMRKDGTLSQMGIWRIKAAVFTKVFPGASGQRLAETFLESLDSNIKNYESAIAGTLPALARAQALISSGQRAADLDLVADASAALDMLARLREQELPPAVYVEQATMFDRELTPTQERLLLYFDTMGRSQKKIRAFFTSYAQLIEDAPAVGQADLFGPVTLSRDQLLDRLI
ncbi:hypothetical protein F8S13_11980 [Chloroflexia bacterium SDU3-3]|nr:hypothetical protein F8S13_11980 [Chloroflexia bacterium SDU3-3]